MIVLLPLDLIVDGFRIIEIMAEQPTNPQGSSLSSAIAKIQPIAQRTWVTVRPTLTMGLKATIGLLESAVNGLETQMQADGNAAQPLNLVPVQKAANTFWTKAQPLWVKVLGLVRGKLPQDVSQKLTDRSLSGILAGIALLVFWVTSHLPGGGGAPKAKPVVAARPTVQAPATVGPKVTAAKPQVPNNGAISQQFPIDGKPTQAFPDSLSAPGVGTAEITPKNPTTSVTAEIKPENPTIAAKPATATSATTPKVEPKVAAPAPKPKPLTAAEKNLGRFREAAGDRAALLTGVKPVGGKEKVQVSLADEWYELDSASQDSLAAGLLAKAKVRNFAGLELLDGQGNVLARSPVVGSEMVILVREMGDYR
jgi:cytoskeletal protein RodZ